MVNVSEALPGSVGNQPWAMEPESKTDVGDAYQPTPETERFLRGEPETDTETTE